MLSGMSAPCRQVRNPQAVPGRVGTAIPLGRTVMPGPFRMIGLFSSRTACGLCRGANVGMTPPAIHAGQWFWSATSPGADLAVTSICGDGLSVGWAGCGHVCPGGQYAGMAEEHRYGHEDEAVGESADGGDGCSTCRTARRIPAKTGLDLGNPYH